MSHYTVLLSIMSAIISSSAIMADTSTELKWSSQAATFDSTTEKIAESDTPIVPTASIASERELGPCSSEWASGLVCQHLDLEPIVLQVVAQGEHSDIIVVKTDDVPRAETRMAKGKSAHTNAEEISFPPLYITVTQKDRPDTGPAAHPILRETIEFPPMVFHVSRPHSRLGAAFPEASGKVMTNL